ncbi:MAG: hypothetical protein HY686_05335 [Chloroflexi bacterium]|nr:hypothetical protein [Chloroflexota bacterium]
MDYKEPGLFDVERELQRFPQVVCEEFQRAYRGLENLLPPHQLLQWAQGGVSLARQSVRAWETAAEYFRVSPEVLPILSFTHFLPWAQYGETLGQDSPSNATAYFRASPACVGYLRAAQVTSWGELGGRLYKGTWKSSALASKFFDVSPVLVRHLTFQELERFTAFISVLAGRSYDLATECLVLAQEVFPRIGDSKGNFISLVTAMADGSWREVKGCFEAGAKALPRVEKSQRARFLTQAERLARTGHGTVSGFLLEGSNALAQIDSAHHGYILSLGEALLILAPESLPEFLRSSPLVLSRISLQQLEVWFTEGARLLRENRDGGLAYFRVESTRSEEVLDALSSAVELGRIKDLMRMYCRALAGSTVEIAPTQELVQKGIGWVSKEKPSTEGSTVFLPPVVDRYGDKLSNFSWYKVVSTHQVAHLEFGSFDFLFERPSVLFRDLRPRLAAGQVKVAAEERLPAGGNGASAETGWLTDMQRFFNLFEDRRLALDIFTVVEDARLDGRVKREYAGIRHHYARVQRASLEERPEIESLPLREALVEFMVRLSLQQYKGLPAPAPFLEEAKAIARVARRVLRPGAAVEDTAEATLRIYAIFSQIPNQEIPEEQWESMDLPDEEEEQEEPEDAEEILQQLQGRLSKEFKLSEEDLKNAKPYNSPKEVEYRGDFKPELVQLLNKLKQTQGRTGQADAQPISKELLEEMLAQSAELEAVQGDINTTAGMFANNLMREAGIAQPPPTPAYGQGPLTHMDDEGGPLQATEPNTFLYDEWDFRADDYKPRWCIVREKSVAEGEITFYYQTLQAHASLVNQIRRQFEMVVPETFRKIKRLQDGEEFDLDAVIEAMVDRRMGTPPSEKIYWRRNKVERDVAVVFLLDMSASTAEAIDEAKRTADDWDAPDDPVEYMLWLRSRRGEGPRRSYKRIIDLEKESTVLLIQALETLGDKYGIYGFSGYGRENVEFYTVKDLEETLSEHIKKRIDKIAPLHATRMGPAIRHVTTKLDGVDAKTKVLFLISDGRPQDRGYSREGVEKEYAVHDTHMALIEAKRKNIVPFCLTVDKAGHDYLKTM